MRNVPRVCFVAILAITCMLWSSSVWAGTSKAPVKLFKEKRMGYTIEYPADWVYEKKDAHTFVFSGPSGTKAWYSTVSLQNVASAKGGGEHRDMDALIDSLLSQFARHKEFAKSGITPFVYSKGGVRLAGKEFIVEYLMGRDKFKQWCIVLPRSDGKVFHVWFYTSLIEQYDEFLGTAKTMLNSWTIIE